MLDQTTYAVLEPNGDRVPDDQHTAFFGNPADAVAHRDDLGDGWQVYRMVPLSEAGYYDWGISGDTSDRGGPSMYVSESAARNVAAGLGKGVVRRRRGTTAWEPVA